MREMILVAATCHDCGCELEAGGARCPSCIAAAQRPPVMVVQPEVLPPSLAAHGTTLAAPRLENLLDNRLVVISVLLVAGPLGLPALWFSRRFSRVTKTVTTVIFFLLTAVLPLVAAWFCFEVLLRPLADAIESVNRP